MTDPELKALRKKLIQSALEIAYAIQAIDEILIPTGPELDPPKKVRWGKVDPMTVYGTPTTVRVDEADLADRAARRMRGEIVLDPLVYETDVDPADELDGVFDRSREDSEK